MVSTVALLLVLVMPLAAFSHSTGPPSGLHFGASRAGDVYARFPNDNATKFTHMVFDSAGDKLFAGAVNRIFCLDADLRVIKEVTTGPKLDSPLCHASGCDSPYIQKSPTNNVNKILVVDPESHTLIACGSVSQGACAKYNTSDVSAPPRFVSLGIAANDETSSTYAFIGPENYNCRNKNNVLYVGTTFTNNGEYRHDVPAISSRRLHDLEFAAFSFSKQSLLRIDVKYRDQFLVKYVYGFNSTDFAYFVIVQKESHLPGQEERGYVTRLARTCISDENYDSYTEVTLECAVRNKSTNLLVNYNLIQDVKVGRAGAELAVRLGVDAGENVLVGVFSPSIGMTGEPQTASAVCAYSLQEIEAKFTENIHMCFNGSMKDRNLGYVSGPILDGKCPPAGSTGNIFYFCDVGLKISGEIPIKAQGLLHFPNASLTAVTLAKTEQHTVAFLGTKNGFVKKVVLSSRSAEYDSVAVDPGFPILPDTAVSPAGDFLYVLSSSKISKVKIEHCGSYANCSACLEAKDPYCGWCSLEKRCTVRSACEKAGQASPRWLSVGRGQQCIDFEHVSPDRIHIGQMTTVRLMIRTLPELPSGAKYRCVFGTADPIDAVVTPSGLLCWTPAVAGRPAIPENEDHVVVPLSIRSSETNKDFVSRNFAYYDCGRHARCKDCVTARWDCNWCVYDNKCTHNATDCHGTDSSDSSGRNNSARSVVREVDRCPRLRKSGQTIYLPNKVAREIVFDVANLPRPRPVQQSFLCVVDVEGAKMMVPARVEEDRYVVCEKTMYSYEANADEYVANVTVVWNRNHHVDTAVVSLYKCDLLGSYRDHPDCSICVTRDSRYDCAWCGTSCTYKESCPHSSFAECPKPRIDMVKPLSGPVEGGTLVIIEGSNLGMRVEDVRGKIRIGKTPCEIVDYSVSVRIVCRTGASAVGESVASIRVGNRAGFTESSVRFSYKHVKLEGVFPPMGPKSGGTRLALTGQYLNVGGSISATLDDLPCHVNAEQASSTRLTCVTSRSAAPRVVRRLTLSIDGANRTLEGNFFNYTQDPTVMEIKPLKSFASGGRMITVHGTNLDAIQKPEMVVYVYNEPNPVNKSSCSVISSVQMECPSPPVDLKYLATSRSDERTEYARRSRWSRTTVKSREAQLTTQIGFVMDDVETVKDLKKHFRDLSSQLLYVEDPKFFQFPNMFKSYKGDTLVIEGQNLNLASDETDVNVTIGTVPCNVTSLALTQLVCSPPEMQPPATDESGYGTSTGLPLVVVRVGTTLRFPIGYLRYDGMKAYAFLPEVFVGVVVGASCLVMFFIILFIVYRQMTTRAEREYKRIQIQMDTLESNVRSECKLVRAQMRTSGPRRGEPHSLPPPPIPSHAFAELQTDMTDLTADLESTGIPTLDHKTYVMKVFFPGVSYHPILNDPKCRTLSTRTKYDAAMFQLEQLIGNRNFVLTFIETLEAQKSFKRRDKVNVASMLMVVLMGKMEYATDVLRCLLLKLIDNSMGTKHPQLLLRRTESVAEKMLTNWLGLCMYNYLKDHAGSSLFLLFKAIKHQIEKGPVDAVTHDARYSLSEERLLREQIDHGIVTIHLIQENRHYEKIPCQKYQSLAVQRDMDEKIQCKVLDCDTITQVKSKILDAVFKNTHFSSRPAAQEMDLEWRFGRGGRLNLQDEDLTTKSVGGWKKLNTLSHYGIKDSALMSLVPKMSSRNCPGTNLKNPASPVVTNGDVEGVSNARLYHLVKPIEEHHYSTVVGSLEITHKAIPELFLTRLLSTKGTVKKFVDDFLTTILTVDDATPPAVKWLFDLLDEAAKHHSITDPEVVHAWKSNSLPLRFWVNFIKNPDFIFDVNKTTTVESCLSVIAQTFIDSCSTTVHRLGKDSPSSKLLFAKDIREYRDMVAHFYYDVRMLTQITDQEMSTAMQQLSVSQAGEFDVSAALKELYIYMAQYRSHIVEALEADPACKKMHLAQKLENIISTLEGEGTIC